MSELKAKHIVDVYDEYSSDPIDEAQVYLKSEADKVIAELQSKITLASLANDCSSIRHKRCNYCSALQHQKYKRCLAMAKSCKDLHDRYKVEYDSDEGFGDGMLKWIRWATKWQKRWLKIAEQFKEAK